MNNTIDLYISSYPTHVQEILSAIREICREEIPDAEEVISYGVPTFKRNGKYVIYFAAFKDHISVYPTTDSLETALKSVLKYKTGKGTLQFPLYKPVPMDLIRKIVKHMLKEQKERIGR